VAVGHSVEGERHMLMADGGGVGEYIKAAGDAALAAGKAGVEDIGFDAAGFDKVIQRLEDVIDEQMKHKAVGEMRSRRTSQAKDAEDWASSYYAGSADTFDKNYGEWNTEYLNRLRQTVDKFKQVKKHYMEREDAIGEQFRSGMKK